MASALIDEIEDLEGIRSAQTRSSFFARVCESAASDFEPADLRCDKADRPMFYIDSRRFL